MYVYIEKERKHFYLSFPPCCHAGVTGLFHMCGLYYLYDNLFEFLYYITFYPYICTCM